MNWTIFFSLLGLLLLAACSAQNSAITEQPKVVKIGVSLPLTGPAAPTGSWIKAGVDLALERLPEEDRQRVQLIVEDDQCNTAIGMNVANKFVQVDNIRFVMGPLCGTITNPTMDFYESNKVVRMFGGFGLDSHISKGNYRFMLLGRVSNSVKLLAPYVRSQGGQNAAILYLDDDYGKENNKYFQKYFTDAGGKIVGAESFARGDTDFRTQLLKLQERHPDSIFIAAHGPALINILKQMGELNINLPKYSLYNTEDTDVVKATGPLSEGIVFPVVLDRTTSETRAWFEKTFREKYGYPDNGIASNSFDSFNILWNAIKNCNEDAECVRAEIAKTKNYAGASGVVSVDEQGVGVRDSALKTVRNGQFVYVPFNQVQDGKFGFAEDAR